MKLEMTKEESKLIIDLLDKSDPMKIYVGKLWSNLSRQYNEQLIADRMPQGQIQPNGFAQAKNDDTLERVGIDPNKKMKIELEQAINNS